MFRVGPTCQLIPKVFSSCRSFFPLSSSFLPNYYLVTQCHSSLWPTASLSWRGRYTRQFRPLQPLSVVVNLDTRIPPLCVFSLNRLHQWMIKTDSDYLTQGNSILSTTTTGIAIQKESIISIITNIGSPVRDCTGDCSVMLLTSVYSWPQNISKPVYTPYRHNVPTIEWASRWSSAWSVCRPPTLVCVPDTVRCGRAQLVWYKINRLDGHTAVH